jgi:hypothetical protein
MPEIPNTHDAEFGKIRVRGQVRQNTSETLSQQTNWAWWHMPITQAIQEV